MDDLARELVERPQRRPPIERVAHRLVSEFYETSFPKPAESMMTAFRSVHRLLAAGWSEADLAWALPEATNVSVGALTFVLNKRRRELSGGRVVISAEEADAVARLVARAGKAVREVVEGVEMALLPESAQAALDKLLDGLEAVDPLVDRLVRDRAERDRKAP